jgi:hypothetical protein
MDAITWTRESALATPALVGKDARSNYRAYAAPDVNDPSWTFIARVRFDPALGAMPAPNSELRSLSLSELLAETPIEHHAWLREVTELTFDRQLRELRDRVDELDDALSRDGDDSPLRQIAAIAAAADSIRTQLASGATP